MKTNEALLALHKTFEAGEDGVKQMTVYLYDGRKVTKLSNEQLLKLTFTPGTVIRMTAVNALDSLLARLEDLGAEVVYTGWHALGIDKGLSPEEIVKAVYESKAEFRRFIYNKPLADLRNTIAMRNAVLQAVGDADRRLQQIGRNMGLVEKSDMLNDPQLGESFKNLLAIENSIVGEGKNGKTVSLETALKNQAKKIPACVLFNKVAGLGDSYVTAATVMSIIQDIDRFPNVASLWSYFGMGVVDGKAPKRKKGCPANWSPAGRKVLYQLGDSIMKNRKNPWRDYYDAAKAEYLAKHEQTCGCKSKAGHPDAQARRKMVKEILKRFYVAMKGEEFVEGRTAFETHSATAFAASAN